MDPSSPILYVDDEPKNLYLFRRMFGRDHRVHTAESGPQALDLLENLEKEEAPHLVISDQRMPGMTGVELLDMLCRERPEIMRLLTTGYSDIDAVVSAINQGGVHRYVRKPWRRADLAAVIEEVLGEWQRGVQRRLEIERLQRRAERAAALRRRLEPASGAAEAAENGGESVVFAELLCVDAEGAARDRFRSVFEKDYRVHTADSGRRALEIVGGHPVDLVMADQETADVEGVRLLETLHAEHPRVLRLITGSLDYQTALEAINVGRVHGYVAKPWRLDELAGQVEELARRAGSVFEERRIEALARRIERDVERIHELDVDAAESFRREHG